MADVEQKTPAGTATLLAASPSAPLPLRPAESAMTAMEKELSDLVQALRTENTPAERPLKRFVFIWMNDDIRRLPAAVVKARKPHFTTRYQDSYAPIAKRSQQSNRAVTMIQQHSVWLHEFRQRIGLERTGTGFRFVE
jgi:hypothetical protein